MPDCCDDHESVKAPTIHDKEKELCASRGTLVELIFHMGFDSKEKFETYLSEISGPLYNKVDREVKALLRHRKTEIEKKIKKNRQLIGKYNQRIKEFKKEGWTIPPEITDRIAELSKETSEKYCNLDDFTILKNDY